MVSCEEIRIPESLRFLLVESEIKANEFRIPHLTIEIQNLSSTDLQRLESRIQDCLEFPYMGRFEWAPFSQTT